MSEQFIASQPITHIEQKIGAVEKHTEQYKTDMRLYHDRIVIDHDSYPIEAIFDISYRYKENEVGFLYLHTSHGVRSYYITEDPKAFIASFREIEQK